MSTSDSNRMELDLLNAIGTAAQHRLEAVTVLQNPKYLQDTDALPVWEEALLKAMCNNVTQALDGRDLDASADAKKIPQKNRKELCAFVLGRLMVQRTEAEIESYMAQNGVSREAMEYAILRMQVALREMEL